MFPLILSCGCSHSLMRLMLRQRGRPPPPALLPRICPEFEGVKEEGMGNIKM